MLSYSAVKKTIIIVFFKPKKLYFHLDSTEVASFVTWVEAMRTGPPKARSSMMVK